MKNQLNLQSEIGEQVLAKVAILRELERPQEIRSALRIACLPAILLYLSFWIIDRIYIPNYLWTALFIRVVASFLLALVFVLSKYSLSSQNTLRLATLLSFVGSFAIHALFVFCNAPLLYSHGLNLVALGTVALIPWKIRTLWFPIALTYAPYVFFISFREIERNQVSELITNALFAIGTICVSVILRKHNEEIRNREARSRFLLGKEIGLRESIIQDKAEVGALLIRDAAIGSVTNQILHDLKSPLTALQVLVNSTQIPANEHSLLNAVNERFKNILKTLGHQNTPIQFPHHQSLQESLHATFVETKYICDARQVALDWNWPTSIHSWAIEHRAINSVVTNMVHNSLRALENCKEKKIAVEFVEFFTENKRALKITASDTGPGISKKIAGKLFKRGFSADGSTGLGLTFIAAIAQSYQGTVALLEPNSSYTTRIQVVLYDQTTSPEAD
jgi:signal transduction histidine kinase